MSAAEPGLKGVRWVDLPVVTDHRGELTIVGHDDIPFSVSRLFWVHRVPGKIERGGHAHRVTEQFILAVSGSFGLDLTDGRETRHFVLDDPNRGIYVPPMVWDRLHDFSADAVCLVLASTQYAQSDYIRNWDDFLAASRVGP